MLEKVQIAINEFKEAASCFANLRQVVIQPCTREKLSWDMTESGLLGVPSHAVTHH